MEFTAPGPEMKQIHGLLMPVGAAGEQVPWAAMEYVVGQINYGGHVTDDMDRRCLMSTLRQFVTPHVMDEDFCYTPASGTYHAPPANASLEDCRQASPAAATTLPASAACTASSALGTAQHSSATHQNVIHDVNNTLQAPPNHTCQHSVCTWQLSSQLLH